MLLQSPAGLRGLEYYEIRDESRQKSDASGMFLELYRSDGELSCHGQCRLKFAFCEALAIHADLEGPLDTWFRIAKKAKWNSLAEIRQTFPSTDGVEGYTVFNIKGNEYRLITRINYRTGRIFIREVLTHGEYDRGSWKK